MPGAPGTRFISNPKWRGRCNAWDEISPCGRDDKLVFLNHSCMGAE